MRLYDPVKSPNNLGSASFEYDVQNQSSSYMEALNNTHITQISNKDSKSDNSKVQMYNDPDQGDKYYNFELQSVVNMPVDSNSRSDAPRDLSDFNPGDDHTENSNSLIEFEQDIHKQKVTDFAKITVAKKKMTRSIFTIEEEAENEDQTVTSYKSGHFNGNPDTNIKPILGKSQYLETNSSIELDVSISRIPNKSPAKINQTYDQILLSGGRPRHRNQTQKRSGEQEIFGG